MAVFKLPTVTDPLDPLDPLGQTQRAPLESLGDPDFVGPPPPPPSGSFPPYLFMGHDPRSTLFPGGHQPPFPGVDPEDILPTDLPDVLSPDEQGILATITDPGAPKNPFFRDYLLAGLQDGSLVPPNRLIRGKEGDPEPDQFDVFEFQRWLIDLYQKFEVPTPPCEPGFERNAAGVCVPSPCPPGFTRNATGECVRDDRTNGCPEGFTPNAAGECVPIDDTTTTTTTTTPRDDGFAGLEGVLPGGFGEPQFDDPGGALLEDLIKIQIDRLFQDRDDPATQQLIQTLQGQFETTDASLERLLADIGLRIDELREAPFSRGEEELFRTSALDRISSQQDAATNRLLEEFGALGRAPTSGVNAELLRQLSSDFASQRTGAETDFAVQAANIRNQRLDQALGLSGQLQGLDRARRAERTGLAGQLSTIEQLIQSDEDTRQREALATAGLLSELPERRLQLALQTLGQGSGPTSLFSALSQFVNLGQGQQNLALQAQQLRDQANQFNQANYGSLFTGLGGLFSDIFDSGTTG